MKPLVYIILLNWNGLTDTLECLESLRKIDYLNYKVVVVDNGSKNNEAEEIKKNYSGVYLIKNKENKGFAEGNNIGIKLALERKADYILLLNNDTVVSPNFLTILVDFAQRIQNIGAVGPKILYYDSNKIWFNGGELWWWIGFAKHLERLKENEKSSINEPLEVDYITGCAMLMKRETIEKVGLLDPVYFVNFEDLDWCWRAKKLGYKHFVVPKSIIWHKVSVSLGKRGTQKIGKFGAYYYARNAIIFAKKNLSGIRKFLFLISQYTFRLPLNLILCTNNEARKNYLKGLIAGFKNGKEK